MDEKRGDLILPQHTYAFIHDGTSGSVEVVNGPFKISLSETDKTVIYDERSGQFVQIPREQAIRQWVQADESEYIQLTNPEIKGNAHPSMKSKQPTAELAMGKKINIPGPMSFALYPEQVARVIKGHLLKSNEYLLVRVYNEEEAKANLEQLVAVASSVVNEGEETKKETAKNLFEKDKLTKGYVQVVKGTEVSFFIPPTGMEVIPNTDNSYIRKAVTLEMLEYCILLSENGNKRFVNGPKVVFPEPTEIFIEKNNSKKFRATELNENMGIYIKVIAKYDDENGKTHEAGEEMFITGKDTKIYYPRSEHSIITYDGFEPIHFATTVPAGEARYVLDKTLGKVNLAKGPRMLLPNPINEVIIKRKLDRKTIELLFPGNKEAIEYNENLEESDDVSGMLGEASRGFTDISNKLKSATTIRASYGNTLSSEESIQALDQTKRRKEYTKPRTITIDSKYEGAVTLNIWPGYAVQVISKSGDRHLEIGPKVIMLEYDETLDVLELSTGKPKTDHTLFKTAYLQTTNNTVSDIIKVETKDMVLLDIRLSYRVNFELEHKEKWFNVSNYVKLMTQNMRSILRNLAKKYTVDKFNEEGADLIRNTILGEKSGNKENSKREGRRFEENGMVIYDVEVLDITVNDPAIDKLIKDTQKKTISNNFAMIALKQEEDLFLKQEELNRKKIEEAAKTKELQNKNELAVLAEKEKIADAQNVIAKKQTDSEIARQQSFIDQDMKKRQAEVEIEKQLEELSMASTKEKMAAITPDLVQAMLTLGQVSFTEILAKNLNRSNSGLAALFNGSGGYAAWEETFKGTPIETIFKSLIDGMKNSKATQIA